MYGAEHDGTPGVNASQAARQQTGEEEPVTLARLNNSLNDFLYQKATLNRLVSRLSTAIGDERYAVDCIRWRLAGTMEVIRGQENELNAVSLAIKEASEKLQIRMREKTDFEKSIERGKKEDEESPLLQKCRQEGRIARLDRRVKARISRINSLTERYADLSRTIKTERERAEKLRGEMIEIEKIIVQRRGEAAELQQKISNLDKGIATIHTQMQRLNAGLVR